MRLPTAASADPLLRAALACGLDAPPSEDTRRLTAYLAAAFGPAANVIIHYGSHAQRSDARPESAHDFFVIVDRYREAYRSLEIATRTRYSHRTAALLARVLPPNVIAVSMPAQNGPIRAKCAVLSRSDFARACSARATDHFTRGRLFQQVQLVWARDPVSHQSARDALIGLRAGTFAWGWPSLPSFFTSETYCRRLLETSFAAEIRPEGGERVTAMLAAQRETLILTYDPLLQWLVTQKILTQEGNVYRQLNFPGIGARLRLRGYFWRSKVRATLRWLKYVALFEGWLDYIVEKIARRSGVSIQLTDRERRWPLIFLWPRVIHFVRHRPQRRNT